MTVSELLLEASKRLLAVGIEEAKNDARLLFMHATGRSFSEVFLMGAENVSQETADEFEQLIARRETREPLQYITGEQEFCGIPFRVRKGVLIPRPETELLCEAVFKQAENKRVLDLCTGSGCIAVTVAKLGKPAEVVASDISEEALAIAEENAEQCGVSVRFLKGDLFESITGRFDIIVSNPPYIESSTVDGLMPEVLRFEPRLALDGTKDGLEFYRRIISESDRFLLPDGKLMFEIGYNQAGAVSEQMRLKGFTEITVKKDYSGLDRCVFGTWSRKEEK